MKKALLAIALVLLASPTLARNYATCLLEKLPGVENLPAVQAAERVCASDYPGGLGSAAQGSGRSLIADYDSGDECILEKSGGTQQARATALIREACLKLYEPEESCRTQSPGPWCKYR